MLTIEENELLTQTGRGTPAGELLRRYWHPIAVTTELDGRWTKRVRVLGEDLVLFRDRSGRLGLIAEACPHRRASFAYGIPTAEGIRCPYHGWMFDAGGRCLEQPNEPAGSTFRDKVTTDGYPVQVLAGMVFAYLGPLPAPLITKLDGLVVEPAIRLIGKAVVPCNWLQVVENAVDPVHAEWLHGHYSEFVEEQTGKKFAHSGRHVKIAFDETAIGIVKRRLLEGQDESASDWQVGHPLIWPTTVSVGSKGDPWTVYEFQFRVPVDDTHVVYWSYTAFAAREGIDIPAELTSQPFGYEIPLDAEDLTLTAFQDFAVWTSQGAVTDRTREALGATDRGITLYRTMLKRELKKVAAGADPMMVHRDPDTDGVLHLPLETNKAHFADGFATMLRRRIWKYAGINDQLLPLFSATAGLKTAEQPATASIKG
jgi:5,5'-dehydrodivanillate O-demethylase